MGPVVVRERYKVIRVTEAGDGYAFAEAVDISERETPARLLNVYEGRWLPVYARIFSNPVNCPDYCESFLTGERLVAVFRPRYGEPLDRVFYRGAGWGWEDRLHYADELMSLALSLADMPAEVSCAAMLPDNVLVDTDTRRISLLFRVRPMENMNARELVFLASGGVRKIFTPGFWQTDAEYAFCRELERGGYGSVVRLYAAWRRAEEEIRMECEQLRDKNRAEACLIFLRKNLKRLFGWKRK